MKMAAAVSPIVNSVNFSEDDHKRVIVIGDVHGDLPRLKSILRHAGLIDERDAWTGADTMLVQLGDTIDRTPEDVIPLGAFRFLRRLQQEARQSGGRVIRLLGNHELMLLEGKDHYVRDDLWPAPDAEAAIETLKTEIKEDILSGNMVGAWSYDTILFVHGGLRTDIRETILNEVHDSQLPYHQGSAMVVQTLSIAINQLLRRAVQKGDFSHPIFRASWARSGSYKVGGPFWTDFNSDFPSSPGAHKVRQVVGHTPVSLNKNIIAKDGQWRIIGMDTAMSRYYGKRGLPSRATYLELKEENPTIWYAGKRDDAWNCLEVR